MGLSQQRSVSSSPSSPRPPALGTWLKVVVGWWLLPGVSARLLSARHLQWHTLPWGGFCQKRPFASQMKATEQGWPILPLHRGWAGKRALLTGDG